MTFSIKLKTGFFRTQSYFLTIDQGQIILTPQEGKEKDPLIIDVHTIQSISLTAGELEIITDVIYGGVFSPQTDLKQLSNLLGTEFGEKFTIHYESF